MAASSTSMTFVNPSYPSPNPGPSSTFSPNLANNAFAPPPPPPPMRDDNIVNKKADTSLFLTCIDLRKRLAYVPGFEPYLREMDLEEMDSGEDTDPVTSMWNLLRQGIPLMAIYNASNPPQPLTINRARVKEPNIPKAAAFKFLQACFDDLRIPQEECFFVTDLYGQDTTGFVKVLRVINRVVDILQARGLLFQPHDDPQAEQAAPAQRSHGQMVVAELVDTERDYVQHLVTLQTFKDQLEQSGTLPGDIIHDIFLNLNNLLDFQQRFLIRIEQQNNLDSANQNWGQIFVQYQDGFRVYEPFIGNQHQGNETVVQNWATIAGVPYSPHVMGMVSSVTVLTGFLLKPFQRLSKYPLLLDELRKRGDLDEQRNNDLVAGATAMKAVLDRANALLHKADLAKEVAELVTLVDDWKGHKLEHFGDLVLHGTFPVIKGESSRDSQRDVRLRRESVNNPNEEQYKIYLFERILLCCKEINLNKAKNRLAGRSNVTKQGKAKLQLKGRIFIQNICDVVQLQPSQNGSPSYTLQVWWKGDPGIESFTIRFPAAEPQKKWFEQILHLRSQYPSNSRQGASADPYSQSSDLISLSGLQLKNPYEQQEEEAAEDPRFSTTSTLVNEDAYASSSRNSSLTNLHQRNRSMANGMPRGAPPPRFPMADLPIAPPAQAAPLKVATNMTAMTDEQRAASAFSPSGDSPSSSRISQLSSYFPRQSSVSNSSWTQPESNKHNTAPPLSRAAAADDAAAGYGMNGRSIQRPSLPAVASHSAAQAPVTRNRSISSPDVNGFSPGRRTPTGTGPTGGIGGTSNDEVPVPPIPPHMASMRGPVNRSNNNSPTDSLRNARGMVTAPPSNANRPTFQYHNSYAYDQTHAQLKHGTANIAGAGRVLSPPMSASAIQPPPEGQSERELPYVSQLKVKVHWDPDPERNYVTIVINANIGWETLRGRIDHKMQKNTRSQIAEGTARLRYVDNDGDKVTINEDEDVDMAIEVWKDANRDKLRKNQLPDLDLYWKEVAPKTPN